jgi:protein-tyrosine-phosphatase
MDRGHLAELRRLAPRGLTERPRMFATADVADPYGGTARDYERALDLIEEGCRDLLATLTPEAKAKGT